MELKSPRSPREALRETQRNSFLPSYRGTEPEHTRSKSSGAVSCPPHWPEIFYSMRKTLKHNPSSSSSSASLPPFSLAGTNSSSSPAGLAHLSAGVTMTADKNGPQTPHSAAPTVEENGQLSNVVCDKHKAIQKNYSPQISFLHVKNLTQDI